MHPEDLPDPGTYVDPETGDIWEKRSSGKWYVNGQLHKPFPHALSPEQVERMTHAAVTIDDVVKASLEDKKLAAEIHEQYEVWRPVIPKWGNPKYEVNRAGDLRYIENHTFLAPSQGDSKELYYPLQDDDHVVHLVPISDIIKQAFPGDKQ